MLSLESCIFKSWLECYSLHICIFNWEECWSVGRCVPNSASSVELGSGVHVGNLQSVFHPCLSSCISQCLLPAACAAPMPAASACPVRWMQHVQAPKPAWGSSQQRYPGHSPQPLQATAFCLSCVCACYLILSFKKRARIVALFKSRVNRMKNAGLVWRSYQLATVNCFPFWGFWNVLLCRNCQKNAHGLIFIVHLSPSCLCVCLYMFPVFICVWKREATMEREAKCVCLSA